MKTCGAKRILMLLENSPYTEDGRVRREAQALRAAGYQLSVICPAAAGQGWHAVCDGVEVYQYPDLQLSSGFVGYVWEYAYALAMMSLLSVWVLLRRGFDVLHTHNPPDLCVVIAAGYKLFGKRFVFDHHDLAPEMYRARFGSRAKRGVYASLVWFEKLSCQLADHVIATNHSYKTMEMERGGVPATRISIVRNGPELERLQPTEPHPDVAAYQSQGKTVIGFVGEMGVQDGVEHLLHALHHLAHELQRTDWVAVLVGTGDTVPQLKALAQQLGLAEQIMFTGFVGYAEVVRYLSGMHICVSPDPSNPYNDRSTMVKIMEYMAMGKPIVAFDLPEHRVSAGDAAVYVQPNDTAAFARALVGLMDDGARRQQMGHGGRRRVEEQLAWPYSIPQLLQVYQHVFPAALKEKR